MTMTWNYQLVHMIPQEGETNPWLGFHTSYEFIVTGSVFVEGVWSLLLGSPYRGDVSTARLDLPEPHCGPKDFRAGGTGQPIRHGTTMDLNLLTLHGSPGS
jgi:hypothetical protein